MAVGGITRIIRGTRNVSTSMHLDGAWAFGSIWPGPGGLGREHALRRHRRQSVGVRSAHDHLLDLRGHRRAGVRRDDLFDDRAPPLQASAIGQLPRKHPRRGALDGHPAADPGGHGDPGDAHADPHLRLQRIGRGCADHRLPVEVALQVSGRGRGVLQQPHHAARADQQPVAQGRALPAGSRRAAGDPGRCQGPLPDHRGGRDPLLVGTGSGGEEGRHSRFHQRILDPRRAAGHLPRPVHRTLRQGPRLHAGGGGGQVAGGLRQLARREEGRGRQAG